MSNKRREFIKYCLQAFVLFFTTGFNNIGSITLHNPHEDFSDALNAMLEAKYPEHKMIESDLAKITLPDVAEDGAVVPISIISEMTNIKAIAIYVEKNPIPLVAEFELSTYVLPYINARIKMAESCYVMVILQTNDYHLLKVQQWVNVMVGGCGTG